MKTYGKFSCIHIGFSTRSSRRTYTSSGSFTVDGILHLPMSTESKKPGRLVCDLGRLPAKRYYESTNIVARLNLPNMAYSPEDRLEMYRAAQTGLAQLERNPEKQRKYADFIDFYADLNVDEVGVYRMRYLSGKGEETMGLVSVLKEEGRQEGIQQGIQQGVQQGIQQGLLEGIEALIEIKFGERGLKLVPDIRKILDTERLRLIKEAIKVSREVQDVEKVIWH